MTIEWNFILRLLVAGLLGGAIGFEREFRAKEAGVRTHFIVALGSALFMLISQYAFSGQFDHSRVAAQVVSGIGFIGAGVIIFQKNVVRGITTAAGLWVAAAIGLACGAGMYPIAIAAMLLTVICLEAMHFITSKYSERIITVSLSPVSSERLLEFMDSAKAKKIEIDSFIVADEKAILQVRTKLLKSTETSKKILTLAKDLRVEIS
ncbi:MAG: MgtC/SapB family protein [Bacteroidales bacterium]|nr:MgtC/SapB family protein [Bacteroidales bacterium]